MRLSVCGSLSLVIILLVCLPVTAAAGTDFAPDPASVQRFGPAYRYPQAGWIVLHIEGEPYERGYQHGRLMAKEIVDYIQALASFRSPKAPIDSWRDQRLLVNALFLRRYDKEYLEEMKGIADGAAEAGAKFDNRTLDLLDIVTLNSGIELDFLEEGLDATATGLEGLKFKEPPYAKPMKLPMDHCSAFAATGPATADGKIVFGHITMWHLYLVRHFNVWIDVKPTKGHRLLMQSNAGSIMSGLDYYMNDGGLLVAETTIRQTKFDINGASMVSRIRKACQYGGSIDEFVKTMEEANNGLYTNEWLLADIKTNEIGMFELGTHKSKLWRSSKNDWIGGTEGFYWGCNNAKDLQVRLETVASLDGKPANVVFRPSDRDKMWQRLYEKHKGKISAEFGFEAFTTPPLAAFPSCDAKFTTTALAKELKTWAIFGPPLGRTWDATEEERKQYPDIKPLVGNDWALLHANPPPPSKTTPSIAVDLAPKWDRDEKEEEELDPRRLPAAWHGTILPKTDADIWLAAAFADYEKIVALEKALKKRAKDGKCCEDDQDKLAVALFEARSRYLTAVQRQQHDLPLGEIKSELKRGEWYDIAAGKGVLVLAELRKLLGDEKFEKLMDDFGRGNAGKPVTTALFREQAEKVHGKSLSTLFESSIFVAGGQTGVNLALIAKAYTGANDKLGRPPRNADELKPFLKELGDPDTILRSPNDGQPYVIVWGVSTQIAPLDTAAPVLAYEKIGLNGKRFVLLANGVLEVADEEAFIRAKFPKGEKPGEDKPAAHKPGVAGFWSIYSFEQDPEQTLIVYGTKGDKAAQKEAAELLQRQIARRWSNYTIPIKADKDVTEDDLKKHHLLLIGRPETNAVTARCAKGLPLSFDTGSFVLRGKVYAHHASTVIAAGSNPNNSRFSTVLFAGLSAEATWRCVQQLPDRGGALCEVLLLAAGEKPKALVVENTKPTTESAPAKP